MKKKLSKKQLKQRVAAGKALAEQRGSEYMSEIGRRGYEVTISKYPSFHLEGGDASWRKAQIEAVPNGYLPNQLGYWKPWKRSNEGSSGSESDFLPVAAVASALLPAVYRPFPQVPLASSRHSGKGYCARRIGWSG